MEFLNLEGLQTFYNTIKNKFIWKVNNKTTSNGSITLNANDVNAIALDGNAYNASIVSPDMLKTGLGATNSQELIISAINNNSGVQIKINGSSLYYRTGTNDSWSSQWAQVELGGITEITSSSQFSPGVVDAAALATDSVTAAAISNGSVGFSKLGSDILPQHVGIKNGVNTPTTTTCPIGCIYLKHS